MRCLFLAAICPVLLAQASTRLSLDRDWRIQSSARVAENGSVLSTAAFQPRDWYATSVPSTVIAALVANGVYPDPDFGMNLRSYPGVSYNVGQNFSNLPMPADSPFAKSWWFRTEFRLPSTAKDKAIWLNFDSINYRANIWLNGHQIASAEQAAGMYRMFEFDITEFARVSGANVLAVEVFPPTEHDLTITFVDWNPMPPDKDMGLVRDVYIAMTGPVAVRHSQVLTDLDLEHDVATLKFATELRNATDREVVGTVTAAAGDTVSMRQVKLAPKQTMRVELEPATLRHPHLWWPYPLGPQNLYRAAFQFIADKQISDTEAVDFGIRRVTSELDAQKHRLFYINGQKILIRGGGWTQDMLLRFSPAREDDELRYVRDMNLNTVRLEGKLMNEHFYNACDRQGTLVMAGWCCCSYWERWRNWKPEDYKLAGESLRDQLRRIRNHPSLLAFLYGSDNSPNPEAEKVYLKVLEEEHWPAPYISSASDRTTPGAGITGVKMSGPYDYVAPNYWLEDPGTRPASEGGQCAPREGNGAAASDTKACLGHGGAWGFNTETGPGPAIPELASLEEMLPKDHLWPIDNFWNYHAGGGEFRTVKLFTTALENRYGKAKNLQDYVRKSQLMAYEGERAMFEAYGRNKYAATGVIQWMINNSWPSIIWHLYDWYLRPGGGYFGAKKACEPLHVQYSYDDRSVVVVNSYYKAMAGYTVSAKVENLDGSPKFSKSADVDIAPDSSTRVFSLPEISGLSDVYFVTLELRSQDGALASSNFYWLSTKPDVSDWKASNWYTTPISSYANFTALDRLPQVELKLTSRAESKGTDEVERVTVSNPTPHLAFFVHVSVTAAGRDVAPVIWEDNDFPLHGGETRTVTATFHRKDLGGARAQIQVDGWNATVGK
ncbi:MAG TPA: beta galactosidase jelly roll domain-containing protein [Bryobacteraceae bacterium]|nr:beta galactosidase jelly roll domain-containing protein [Bryobacteraceae bacterium]